MSQTPVRIERRAGQRFSYLIPLSLSVPGTSTEGVGFTQDVSSRGVFFFTDTPLAEGSPIELTLKMPSEITLGESMRVRCRGRVLRLVKPQQESPSKMGVAVRLEGYEYLAEPVSAPAVTRAPGLASAQEEETAPTTFQPR